MTLAGGHDSKGGIRQIIDAVVNRVGLDKGLDGAQLVPDPGFDLGAGQIGQPHVQPVCRSFKGRQRKGAIPMQVHRLAALHRFRDRLEPHPCA